MAGSVLRRAQEDMLNYQGSGMSVMEMSHRSAQYQAIFHETKEKLIRALGVPDTHAVLFLQGGASTQFSMVPLNLLPADGCADYAVTGHFSANAAKEAAKYGTVHIAADTSDVHHTRIPAQDELHFSDHAAYFHYCANNTIYGTEYHTDIDCPVNLIADMSSDILSRPVDVTKYAMIYGGAQKNLGPAGATFAIIREDIVGKVSRALPSMVDYRNHMDNNSMYNTPPVFPVYVIRETLKWIKSIGGVEEIYRRNKEKADLLYAEIDRNPLFRGTAEKEDRSLMNICFVMNPEYEALAPEFMEFAKARGMVGIKGHRLVGGFRASCYNALPKESVEALVATMQEFEKLHVK
jgi:phosphoserine aminotransferase